MNIKFADEKTFEEWRRLADETRGFGQKSLAAVTASLLWWYNWDDTAIIARDFIKDSFTFACVTAEGKRGVFGGIVRHEDGYQTHT